MYQERYQENKRKERENFELYKKYGGEKEYYKQMYTLAGFYGATPDVTGARLAGTAGLDGLTATDVRAGKERADGAEPVVG